MKAGLSKRTGRWSMNLRNERWRKITETGVNEKCVAKVRARQRVNVKGMHKDRFKGRRRKMECCNNGFCPQPLRRGWDQHCRSQQRLVLDGKCWRHWTISLCKGACYIPSNWVHLTESAGEYMRNGNQLLDARFYAVWNFFVHHNLLKDCHTVQTSCQFHNSDDSPGMA